LFTVMFTVGTEVCAPYGANDLFVIILTFFFISVQITLERKSFLYGVLIPVTYT